MILNKTQVYDEYWKFACKRQDIFFSRFNDKSYPWSNDTILQEYKFTNAYRVTDRVSQYLIKNIIYSNNKYTPEDILFRILFFKFFNKIETWYTLEKVLGEVSFATYNRKHYEKILDTLVYNRKKIYSAAYIMPSGKSSFGYDQKYKNNLSLIELMMKEHLAEKIAKIKSLKQLYEILLSYPSIGKFLAFQYAIDINYSELCDFSEMSFVIAGPGAQKGIAKCFSQNKYDYENIIYYVAEHQEEEFARRGLKFKTLFGRQLQLIDCQNLFCEIDKYARVAYPTANSKTKRTRIKQKFKPNTERVIYFFPPKWGINFSTKVQYGKTNKSKNGK
jgi:hypothetical protein